MFNFKIVLLLYFLCNPVQKRENILEILLPANKVPTAPQQAAEYSPKYLFSFESVSVSISGKHCITSLVDLSWQKRGGNEEKLGQFIHIYVCAEVLDV